MSSWQDLVVEGRVRGLSRVRVSVLQVWILDEVWVVHDWSMLLSVGVVTLNAMMRGWLADSLVVLSHMLMSVTMVIIVIV